MTESELITAYPTVEGSNRKARTNDPFSMLTRVTARNFVGKFSVNNSSTWKISRLLIGHSIDLGIGFQTFYVSRQCRPFLLTEIGSSLFNILILRFKARII